MLCAGCRLRPIRRSESLPAPVCAAIPGPFDAVARFVCVFGVFSSALLYIASLAGVSAPACVYIIIFNF